MIRCFFEIIQVQFFSLELNQKSFNFDCTFLFLKILGNGEGKTTTNQQKN